MPDSQERAFLGESVGGPPQLLADGLPALIGFARRASGADVAIAFEAGTDEIAVPVATDPRIDLQSFSLPFMRISAVDWSLGPADAELIRLPATIAVALGRAICEVLFIATPIADVPRSGILLMWHSKLQAPAGSAARAGIWQQIVSLSTVFAQMLGDRRVILHRRDAVERFHDLLGSVPIGIVVFEGNGQTGLVNKSAAHLLGTFAGELAAHSIVGPMRELRGRCKNAGQLNALYSPLQNQRDYAVKAIWDLGGEKYDVDTHPVLGNGRNGRIWLFHNITAQLAIENDLRQLSVTDPLTGLNNRRQFFLAGEGALKAPWNSDLRLAVMMVDIDHFKSINDTYGHQVGDEVLVGVCACMREMLRGSDLIARIGGEEFGVLLHGLTLAEVRDWAERLRAEVAKSPIATTAMNVEVRVSIGASQRRISDINLEQILERADRALYAAKNGGRNRVMIDTS